MSKRMSALMLALLPAGAMAFGVPHADPAPVVDGEPADPAWERAQWVPLQYLMAGTRPEADDFSGRYKLLWTQDHLYLLAEITDDVLYDSHPDPLDAYWEDDALEILIDEDRSGGDHLYSYNAFAYHIALDNQVVDVGPFLSPQDRAAGKVNRRVYEHHAEARWRRSRDDPTRIYWEVRITAYSDAYTDDSASGEHAVRLTAGKVLGFMVAYCDADGMVAGGGREHFLGDVEIEPVNGDRNRPYIDASVFGEIVLVP
jgi:hypothetical protein